MPQTQYARKGDAHIAYQIVGEGNPLDIVLVSTWFSHVEARWDLPGYAHYLSRLASFSRLISFDKYGIGLFDPIRSTELPPLEDWMDDVSAVMDAARSQAGRDRRRRRGLADGGALRRHVSRAYERSRPDERDRTRLGGAGIRNRRTAGSAGRPRLDGRADVGSWRHHRCDQPEPRRRFRCNRGLGTLPSPLRKPGNGCGRHAHAFRARRSRRPSIDQGAHARRPPPGQPNRHRRAGTVFPGAHRGRELRRRAGRRLRADIVDSTPRAVELGDARWRELLERHDELAATEVARFGGTISDFAGDGLLATFDGPARAVRCAYALRERLRTLGLDMRAGLHTGEVERRRGGIAGIGVHIAARVNGLAGAGEVLVSRTVRDLVTGSGLSFVERGAHSLKGVPDQWEILEAVE